uniref:Uncharacterized protein n=1 Tax=Cucumis sativus TaxID=3659 RepID=A0A0A0KWZ9_CUCSA
MEGNRVRLSWIWVPQPGLGTVWWLLWNRVIQTTSRVEEQWIFSSSNSRGRFALLSLESFKGRKMRIFIPEGIRGSGWRMLAGEVSGVLPSVGLGP